MKAILTSVGFSLLLSTVACVDYTDPDCEEITLLGICNDNASGYGASSPPNSLGAYLGDGARCPGQGNRCSIAVAGTDTIRVGPGSAENLQVEASAGFELTAIPTAPVQPLAFVLRAPGEKRQGTIALSSSNMATAEDAIAAHAVYDLGIVAAEGPNRYSRVDYAVPASEAKFVVAIWSNEDSGQNPPYEPSRLVDTSLRSESPAVVQLSWDTFAISASTGIYPIEFVSDSMGTTVLDIVVTAD